MVGRRFRIKKAGGPPNARHRIIVARVGDKCHLEVEVHGADYRTVERGVPKVTKEAGRGSKAAEARRRRPCYDQGRREPVAARVGRVAGPDAPAERTIKEAREAGDGRDAL